MSTAAKQIRSATRYVEDLKVVQGEIFNEAMTISVMAYTDHLKETNGEMNALAANGSLKAWGEDVTNVFVFVGDNLNNLVGAMKVIGLTVAGLAAASNLEIWDSAGRSAIKEQYDKDVEAIYANEDRFSKALDARRAALRADGEKRIAIEHEYAQRALEVQLAYANQSIEVQRAAQIALAKNMIPLGMVEAPKIAAGGDDKAKALTEYQRLIKAIQEKTAADMLDMQTQGSLTAGQKEAVKIMEDLRDGTLKLTQIEKIHLAVVLERRLATEAQKIEEERAMKQTVADAAARQALRTKEDAAIEAYMLAQEEARHKAEQGAKDQLKAAQDQYDQYGMTKSQIEALIIAELRLKQARVTADSEEYKSLERQIELRGRIVTVMANIEELDRQKEFWSSVEQNAHSTFSNVLQGGQDVWTKLRSTGQAIFVDWLYQMTVKKWLFNISANISGSGVANSAIPGMGSGSGSSIVSDISSGKSVYDMASGGMAGVGSTVSTVGNLVGSASLSAYGAGMGLSTSAATAAAAAYTEAAASIVGSNAALAATYTEVAGSITAGAGASAGVSSALAAIPVWGWIAMALLTQVGGPKIDKVGDGLSGTLAASGSSIQQRTDYTEDHHGLFGMGAFTTHNSSYSDASAGTSDYINAMVTTVTAATKGYAAAIGLSATAVDGFTQQIDLSLTGLNPEQQKAEIDKAIGGFADAMVQSAYGGMLSGFAIAGETASTTLQRVATEFSGINNVMAGLGYTLFDVSAAGLSAAEGLSAAFGGLQNFQAQMSSYYQGYYSPSEQRANTINGVVGDLGAAGISGYSAEQIGGANRDQIRAVVDAYAANKDTVEGAKQYAAVIKAANALTAVTPALTQAVAAPVQQMGSSGGGGGGGAGAIETAAQAIAKAMQAGADGIWAEVKRIHGALTTSAGSQGLADVQAQFAIATANARAGNSDAVKALPGISQAMLVLMEANARTLQDLQWMRGQTAASLTETGNILSSQYGLSVPSLDGGTNNVPHDMLIMAHRGEAVVPQQYNHANGGGSDNSDLLAELQGMRLDLADARRELAKISESSSRTAYIAQKSDTIGPAPARSAA